MSKKNKGSVSKATLPSSKVELGATGLEHWSGLIREEFLTSLDGRKGRETYREMSNNDSVVGSMLFAVEMFLRPVKWSVKPFDDSAKAKKDAKFVEEVYGDMMNSWAQFISEWMAAPIYGYAPFEIVWKVRRGYKRNRKKTSKYSDGKIGISRLAIRHPDTLDRWEFDDQGDLTAMHQLAAPDFKRVRIPAEKMLIFNVMRRKGNPEGTSLLRRSYVAWYRKKRIEEIEAIGIERELAGLPLFHTPAQWWAADASDAQKNLLSDVKEMARRIRSDEQAAVVLPAIYDSEGNQLLTFELVSTGGTRAIDTSPPKEYYSRQIAMTIMADILLLGHDKVGSFALSDSKTNLFANGLEAILDSIADVHNQDLIPRILAVNGRDPSQPPTLVHGDIETPDLDVVGEYVSRLAGAGLQLFPTEKGELERELFRIANLPEDAADEIVERTKKEKEERERMAHEIAEGGGPPQPGQNGQVDQGLAGNRPPTPQQQNAQDQRSSSRPAQTQLDRAKV